ncbi:little elongation complex subunit 1-like [Silurus meridionalis]|uniref:little elongation complex subunit 1-like n=1 Tax=Silurus meridionalis TaxID=175797 RepID=UPI001EE9C5BD|nr:little elongation complex subunit 1-like [Silurus meridionalis]
MVMISVLLPGTTYSAWTFSVHNWAGFGPSPMLYGRLGQNGLKENVAASVEDLVKSVNEFRGQKDLPWELQLAVVYATHDLAPSNPKVALNALESWRKDLTKPVPPAVTKCLKQISFLCSHIKTKKMITLNNV